MKIFLKDLVLQGRLKVGSWITLQLPEKEIIVRPQETGTMISQKFAIKMNYKIRYWKEEGKTFYFLGQNLPQKMTLGGEIGYTKAEATIEKVFQGLFDAQVIEKAKGITRDEFISIPNILKAGEYWLTTPTTRSFGKEFQEFYLQNASEDFICLNFMYSSYKNIMCNYTFALRPILMLDEKTLIDVETKNGFTPETAFII